MIKINKKIGIVSCDKWVGKIKEDIEIMNTLKSKGFIVDIISWEDKNILYSDFFCLIIRSIWGYQNKYHEFNDWLDMIQNMNIETLNKIEVIKKNIDKFIQFNTLKQNKIKTIPTYFIKKIESVDDLYINTIKQELKDITKIVVKPIVSGSGDNTNLIDKNNYTDEELINLLKKVFKEIKNSEGIMIQPYIKGVENGEYSLIYINNEFSHSMIRYPGIFTIEKKVVPINKIPQSITELADKISNLPEYSSCLFLRIDLVATEFEILVMEVEAADPDLLTRNIVNKKKRKKIFESIASKAIDSVRDHESYS